MVILLNKSSVLDSFYSATANWIIRKTVNRFRFTEVSPHHPPPPSLSTKRNEPKNPNTAAGDVSCWCCSASLSPHNFVFNTSERRYNSNFNYSFSNRQLLLVGSTSTTSSFTTPAIDSVLLISRNECQHDISVSEGMGWPTPTLPSTLLHNVRRCRHSRGHT